MITLRIFIYVLLASLSYASGAFFAHNEILQNDKFFCFTSSDRHGWNWDDSTDAPIFCEPYGFEDEERYYSATLNVNHYYNEIYRDIYAKDSGTMLLLLIDKTPEKEK